MRVPQPVKVVFDKLPLATYRAHSIDTYSSSTTKADQPVVAVYSIDEDGLPLDPKCLMVVGALTVASGQKPQIEVRSPYISSAETLPLLRTAKNATADLDQIMSFYQSEKLSDSPEFKIFRSLVDTWLDDAWHSTIMDADNARARDIIYGDSTELPWPFTRIAASQLDEHLDNRNFRAKQASGDDYECSPSNMNRAAMAVTALRNTVSIPLTKEPSLIDILVFAYTWPIIQVIPETALAALITPELRSHAEQVRQFLLR